MYRVDLAHLNYSNMGIYQDNERIISFTSIDFYNVFDYMTKFLKKNFEYKRPRLYPTKYDESRNGGYVEIRETWGNKYKLNIQENRSYGNCYGEYTMEELNGIYDAMKDYVETHEQSIIFECRSQDIIDCS